MLSVFRNLEPGLVRSLYSFYMIPESIREDIAQRTRERREQARKSPNRLIAAALWEAA